MPESPTPPPAPEIPISNFTTFNTVTIPHALSKVFPVLASGASMESVARLSDLCTSFTTGETKTISIAPGLLSTARGTSQHPTSRTQSGLSRTSFVLEETVPIMKGLFKSKVRIEGSQTEDWEGRCCLYESVAEKQGIFIWKLRTFEEVDGGKATKVTERIEGSYPGAWMRYLVEKECKRANLAHMEKYHTLFN